MWFKNRRAKFRKKQRSLQKEQLQKQKEATNDGSQEEGKTETPAATSAVSEGRVPSPPSSSALSDAERLATQSQPGEMNVEVNVTSPEPSDSESAVEDNCEREEELREETRPDMREESQAEAGHQPGNGSPSCKRLSPTPGESSLFNNGEQHLQKAIKKYSALPLKNIFFKHKVCVSLCARLSARLPHPPFLQWREQQWPEPG